jgi:tRNA-2-methylthio-N6-dimethylallyladenosine synthase
MVPGIMLSTDVIVGFPGETDADFEDTMSLTAAVGFESMFSFKYSARPNTLAQKRFSDDVTDVVKTRRIVALQSLQREIQLQLHGALVDTEVDVLVDSLSRRRDTELSGRTSGNMVVIFTGPRDWYGHIVPVRVMRAGPHNVDGEAILAAAPLDSHSIEA